MLIFGGKEEFKCLLSGHDYEVTYLGIGWERPGKARCLTCGEKFDVLVEMDKDNRVGRIAVIKEMRRD